MKKLKLPIKGITADEVLHLWQQGLLYVAVVESTETADERLKRCRQEALAYVQCLEPYVNAQWLPIISHLWQAIVCDESFALQLSIQKGCQQGQLNRYIITNIVFHLKALDIYQCDTLLELHKTMEGVEQKNSIYKAAVVYGLTREQRIKIRELAQKVAGQK